MGVLGLATIALARVAGAEVIALSGRDSGLDEARAAGADRALLIADEAAANLSADIVVTTSNDWNDWRVALRAARRGGTIAVLGFPGRGQPAPDFNPLDSQYFYDKQLSVLAAGSVVESDLPADVVQFTLHRNMAYLFDLIAAGRIPAAEFCRHIRPAAELASVYEELAARPAGVPTIVLRW
jgi:threonine dehydrogenase-like Zn-dependent dehydrogenase